MEFDEKGRLWVTQSSEYPMAAPSLKGHDKITILDDTDGDGKADKFIPFATDLNIPIGIIPVQKGAIAFSIPNVYKFNDEDGDGISESKQKLLGEFGYQDTHGMVNNFARGFDGWIYACHGFTNTSTIAGTDRDSITMVSGNTFRFKEDGSRVEQTSYGRVNPFGYTFDEMGYLYSVDCHSKPIYQLIKGGEYPHFGKKTPAMGYAPEMMSFELGSTALSGLDYYLGEQFPEEYRNSFYNGDVVTCRINRNTMSFSGSSPEAKREEDFLISADPWFRPVAVKEGPDGALYIADFYNRIIGHYEVPLDHPLRDRQSGRIWKITYVGDKPHKNHIKRDWTKASLDELIKNLDYPQLNLRMAIANQVVQRFGQAAVEPLIRLATAKKVSAKAGVQAMWALFRLNALKKELIELAFQHEDPLWSVHVLRILSEQINILPAHKKLVLDALENSNAHVQRAAAEVLAKVPELSNISALLSCYHKTAEKDSHLKYTLLLALRENLKNPAVMHAVAATNWPDEQLQILVKVTGDVPSSGAALFVMQYLENHELQRTEMISSLEFIARYISPSELGRAIALIQKRFSNDINAQYVLFSTMQLGLQQSGSQELPAMKKWATQLAENVLSGISSTNFSNWNNEPLEVTDGDPQNPWTVIDRPIVPELPRVKLIWSELYWYAPMGTLVSPEFKIPTELEMSVFDNDVHNTVAKTGVSKNIVRIRLAKTRQVIGSYRSAFSTPMGMADLMKQVPFDLSKYAGQLGYIEVIDSTKTGSIGIGGFQPEVLTIPDLALSEIAERYTKAAELAGDYKMASLTPELINLLLNKRGDYKTRSAAASSLIAIDPAKNSHWVEETFSDLGEPQLIKEKMVEALGQSSSPSRFNILQKGLAGSTRNLQVSIASILVNSEPGISRLLAALKQEDIQYDLLSDVVIKERLSINMNKTQREEFKKLSAGQASASEARKALISARLASFNPATVSLETGKAMFIQNCSMCHQIRGTGGMIGPQLDGIGNWGQKALTEKILDPNRNISQAFRTYTITLNNGKVLSGLFRREQGAVLVFANPGGSEFTVAKADIKNRVAAKYTLMPDEFRNTISEKDFDALLKFLLANKE